MKKLYIILSAAFLFTACKKENHSVSDITVPVSFDSFIDIRDGHTYKTIKVGNQEWMAENLKYRLPSGSLDGCYTFGEVSINPLQVEVDRALFKDSANAAIARGEIVDPPGLPAAQRPTTIIPLYINYFTPRQLMDRLTPYPDVVNVLNRINNNLLGPAIITTAGTNLQKAELENGNYAQKYGFVYTYKAAQKAAPSGWRLATDADWKELEKNLGIAASEIDKLEAWRGNIADRLLEKKISNIGFNAVLGGGRLYGVFMYGTPFLNKEVSGYYWTATEYQATDSTILGITRNFTLNKAGIWRGTAKKEAAYHIRCIKIK